MRKTILLFAGMIILSVAGFSQAITLNIADIASIGANFNQRGDTVLNLLPENAGASQTWDFHTLTSGASLTKNISAVNPASLACGSRFVAAGANIAITQHDTLTNYYFNKSASGVAVVGYSLDLAGNGDTVCLIFSQPDTMITFPTTYNTTFNCNITGDTKSRIHIDTVIFGQSATIDSARIRHIGTKSSVFDAWGTLMLPNGNVQALRQTTHEVSVDSAWVFINTNTLHFWYFIQKQTATTNQFIWWARSVGLALVTMDYDSTTSMVTGISWLHVADLGIKPYAAPTELVCYPNPARETISIKSEPGYSIASIIDITGQEVFAANRTSEKNFNINVSGLSNGVYFARLTGNNLPPLTRKFVVQH